MFSVITAAALTGYRAAFIVMVIGGLINAFIAVNGLRGAKPDKRIIGAAILGLVIGLAGLFAYWNEFFKGDTFLKLEIGFVVIVAGLLVQLISDGLLLRKVD